MSDYLNRECDRIPKFRMEMTGRRGVEIWIDGVNISDGVRSVTFSAEGCLKSPVLNLSLDVGDFNFHPEKDLKGKDDKPALALNVITEENKTGQSTDDSLK